MATVMTDAERLNGHAYSGNNCRLAANTAMPSAANSADRAGSPQLPLSIWLSPSFPVGSFAFSHGIEWAVQTGDVRDLDTTRAWIGSLLDRGSARNDAIIASVAWRAVTAQQDQELRDLSELALAMAGSRERYLETTAQGNAFIAAIKAAWGNPTFDWAVATLSGSDVAYPLAVAMASAAHTCPRITMLEMYVLAFAQNLVSAAIRLGAIGHSDGQRVLAALLAKAAEAARHACNATVDDLGSATFRSEIAALRHESQYSRLFRS